MHGPLLAGVCYVVSLDLYLKVLFCQLTDYQREIYQDFLRSKAVEEMLAGQRQVNILIHKQAK